MIISPELEGSLNLAIEEAKKYGHEYLTVEHLLYALLLDASYVKVILACGGSVKQTLSDLRYYFDNHLEKNILSRAEAPQPTLSFQRVIRHAAQHVLSSGKEKIYGDSVLVAIFSEKETYASYFLEKQSITQFDVINFLSHGVVKEGVDPEALENLSETPSIAPTAHAEDAEDAKEKHDDKSKADRSDPIYLYAEDLVDKAKEGRIDPLVGREDEIGVRRLRRARVADERDARVLGGVHDVRVLRDAPADLAAGDEQQAVHALQRGAQRGGVVVGGDAHVDALGGDRLGLHGVADDGDDLLGGDALQERVDHEPAEMAGCGGDRDGLGHRQGPHFFEGRLALTDL